MFQDREKSTSSDRPRYARHHGLTGASSGFTLIEVMIVFLVIAILAAIAVPQILEYMKLYRLGVASRNVATAIQRARYVATSNNSRAGIVIQDSGEIDIELYDPQGVTPPQNKGIFLLPDFIRVSGDAPKQVDFDGRGVMTPMPATGPVIRLNGMSGYFATVTVSPTGQVTVSNTTKDSSL